MIRLKPCLLFLSVICLAGILGSCGGVSGNNNPGPSFTLSSVPSTVYVPQGGQGTSTITVTPANGFNGSVSLSASGLPSGVTASFNPPSTTTSSTLTLSASGSAPTGTATVTIKGTSGTLTNNMGLGVNVTLPSAIQHVVIIYQENRTPDNLFQGLCSANGGVPGCGTGPGQYDLQSYGYQGGTKVTLTPITLGTDFDIGHGHPDFLDDCDWNGTQCNMDGFDPRGYQYVQLSGTDPDYTLQPYFTMAETYAFGDRMFQTNQGPSFPAHQYILSGTSAVCVPGGDCPVLTNGSATTSTFYVADNPAGDNSAGCLAPPGVLLNVIDTSQPFPNSTLPQIETTLPGDPLAECFEHPTLTDLLDKAGLSWKYYAPSAGKIWTAPDAIEHMCQPFSADGKYDDTVCNGPDWTNPNPNMVIEGTGAQVITDIQNCQLASVIWVIPAGQNSDHAGGEQVGGPSWVASIVNQIGTNPPCPQTNEVYWNDTAIIVTWDDWGGWYDHVPPPIRNSGSDQNSYEYGFRVPLIVISPYAKPAYVSHQLNDFGSILKFIEETFSLPTIGQSVGVDYADSYALGDLSDFFDFSQSQAFKYIEAPLKADYFLNDKSPPAPPDND